MTKRTLQILLTAMVAVVLMGLTGCDAPAEDTGTEPTTDAVVSEDSTVPPVSETTTDTPSCLKADGPGCVEDDTVDPPVEVVEPSLGCETIPWATENPGAKKMKCISEWGDFDTCDVELIEDDGICVVLCPPLFNQRRVDSLENHDSSGFELEASFGLVTCKLITAD